MRPADLSLYRAPPLWRWLVERWWGIEHAFERARASDKMQDDTRLRIFFVLSLFAAGFLTLAVGATKTALFPNTDRNDYAAGPAGARADLVDRNGQLLAVDLPHFGVYLDPREIWDTAETRRVLPTALPGLSRERLEHALHSGKREYLAGGLTPAEKDKVRDLGLPGVSFEPESRRVYPLGVTGAHLVGIADKGGAGVSGAELALDDAVRANAGKAAVPLSIDLRVQSALQDELEKAAIMHSAIGGVGIVVNVHTGEILGMASYPAFDPNNPGASAQTAQINHAAATVYEPGSVFKVFTLAMGLDAGVATVDTMFDVKHPLSLGRQTIHDYDKGDVMLPLWEVFTHSSNIGAARLGMLCGADRMDRYFRNFGLFAAAPSELSESARPIAPRSWSDNTVASMSFGHAISVSPLALATGMNAIVNGGMYIPLTIRKLDPGARPQGRRVISETTSRTMLDLMRLNVTQGTGGKADVPGLSVGGKTGSAEKAMGGHYERKKLVSSFAAVFPTNGPMEADRYFVLIMLDEPQATKETYGFATGGWTAAPAAGKVINRIYPFLGLKREPAEVVAAEIAAAKPGASPQVLTGNGE